MSYSHQFIKGGVAALPVGKVVCVGRNYAEHAKELNNPVPSSPLLFIKPSTSVVSIEEDIVLPASGGSCHFETEISVLIGDEIAKQPVGNIQGKIAGYGLGLDLTLRDLQDQLKSKGHPWEIAKSFDGACPLSAFVEADKVGNPEQLGLRARVNGELRQKGFSLEMISSILPLISTISYHFTLLPGDVVMTGTPAGVGPLQAKDVLFLQLLLKGADDADKCLAEFDACVAS